MQSVGWFFDFDPTSGSGVAALRYAFGVRTDDHSLWFHLGTSPTAWIKVGSGSGGGGGSTVQAWSYVVTGSEPDLSEIQISLPVPILAAYTVTPVCQDCAGVVGVSVDNMTNNGFTVTGTGKFSANDVIGFIANPHT